MLRGVGLLGSPDGGMDITRCIESVSEFSQGPGVLPLLVPGVAVGVIIDCHCVADRVEVTS